VLTLLTADTGSITTASSGAVVASGVTIGNATTGSAWTAEGGTSIAITATDADTATITGDSTLTAGGTDPTITVAAGKTLSTTASIDLGTAGSLVLTSVEGDGGAKLTGTGAVVVGGVTIVGGTGSWQAVKAVGATTITIDATNGIKADAATGTLTAVAGIGEYPIQPSITVAAGGTLTIAANTKVLAGNLELDASTSWLATDAAAMITTDKITLGENAGAKFGSDNGSSATVLTGDNADTNTFIASGAKVTLGQSTNALIITGAEAGATLTTGATAGINVTDALTITTATVDISVAPTSIINLVNTKTITLSDTDSVIKLQTTDEGMESEKIFSGRLTIGNGVTVYSADPDAAALVYKFVGKGSDTQTITGANVSGTQINNELMTDS
jgi:hypothetical protein